MRWSLAFAFSGCVALTKVPADQPCDDAISAYAVRLFECTEDAARADRDARALDGAHQCAIAGYVDGGGAATTNYGVSTSVPTLELEDGSPISLAEAFVCGDELAIAPCDVLRGADPEGPWLSGFSNCGVILAPR